MKRTMKRRFTIKPKLVGKPLSFKATAKKYGLTATDTESVSKFVKRESDPNRIVFAGKSRTSHRSRSSKLKVYTRRAG